MNTLKLEIKNSEIETNEKVEPGTTSKCYCFRSDFVGFSGHFPGYSILPALVQLQIALILAEEIGEDSLELDSVERAKFLIEIHPDQEIKVYCRRRSVKGRPSVEVSFKVEGSLASSMLLTFRGD